MCLGGASLTRVIDWSAGPPRRDNIMKIQNITMYYNTANDGTSGSC